MLVPQHLMKNLFSTEPKLTYWNHRLLYRSHAVHIMLKTRINIERCMVSKEIFLKVLEKKIRKYPSWLQEALRGDLLEDFDKFKSEMESEIRKI